MGDTGSRITPWTAHPSMGNDLYSLHYLNSCTGFRQTHWKIFSCGNWILLMWLQLDTAYVTSERRSRVLAAFFPVLWAFVITLLWAFVTLHTEDVLAEQETELWLHWERSFSWIRPGHNLFDIHALWNKKLLSYSSSYKSSDYNLHWASVFSPKHQYFPVTPDAGHMLHHG